MCKKDGLKSIFWSNSPSRWDRGSSVWHVAVYSKSSARLLNDLHEIWCRSCPLKLCLTLRRRSIIRQRRKDSGAASASENSCSGWQFAHLADSSSCSSSYSSHLTAASDSSTCRLFLSSQICISCCARRPVTFPLMGCTAHLLMCKTSRAAFQHVETQAGADIKACALCASLCCIITTLKWRVTLWSPSSFHDRTRIIPGSPALSTIIMHGFVKQSGIDTFMYCSLWADKTCLK